MILFYKRLFYIIPLTWMLILSPLMAQEPCENGRAGGYPCNKVDLQGRLASNQLTVNGQPTGINDIWGWTDETTGKEYALVGMFEGTSFVDVTDPANPILLGMLPEHHAASGRKEERGAGSSWRDIKVYKDHAFVVSEDQNHGMQVFDLTQLRDVTGDPVTFGETAHYADFGNAHNIVINEQTGFAYATGATSGRRCKGGGMHIINIQDPANPVYAGCFDDAGYSHDAQCVVYRGADVEFRDKEICFNSNEKKIVIADLSDKTAPQLISDETYSNVFYTHQGWLSDDHRYFFSNDELDELNAGGATKTFIWNVENLRNPVLTAIFRSSQLSIDHNLYIKGDYMYQSNYTSGLRILNIKDVANNNISEVGYFDTYNIDDDVTFNGSWSNYPFFESGNIIVSDRQNGLFIVTPNIEVDPGNGGGDGNGQVTAIGDDPEERETFTIFPNPATREITINFLDLGPNPVTVSLFDVNGQKLYQGELASVNYSGQEKLDVSALKRGMYHLRLTNGTETIVKRVALQ